jgi:hypothetical protein
LHVGAGILFTKLGIVDQALNRLWIMMDLKTSHAKDAPRMYS